MSRRARFTLSTLITLSLWMYLTHMAFGNPGGSSARPPTVAAPNNGGCAGNCAPAPVSATGWIRPVNAPIWGGFRTPSNPTHDGVDLGAARGTPIRAAAAGTVVTVLCNVPTYWNCDRDGSPQITGCGWYVDIRHAGDIYTRYCHQGHRPDVNVGDTVTAGQVIGNVGSTGNSSAPHLHFEVHLGDQSSATATDPVVFMADHGAPLGTS